MVVGKATVSVAIIEQLDRLDGGTEEKNGLLLFVEAVIDLMCSKCYCIGTCFLIYSYAV